MCLKVRVWWEVRGIDCGKKVCVFSDTWILFTSSPAVFTFLFVLGMLHDYEVLC